jgi:hypothetical protein
MVVPVRQKNKDKNGNLKYRQEDRGYVRKYAKNFLFYWIWIHGTCLIGFVVIKWSIFTIDSPKD